MFGPNIESMCRAGDIAGLLTLATGEKQKKARKAFDALGRVDDTAIPALAAELEGSQLDRRLAAAIGLATKVEQGSQPARDVASGYVSHPSEVEVTAVLLEALAQAPDADAAEATLSFLGSPICPLCRPRSRNEIEIMPDRMTANQMMGMMMTPDDRRELLVPAFTILAAEPRQDATEFLTRELLWQDPTVQAFAEELAANDLLSHELSRVDNADFHIKEAAVAALSALGDTKAVRAALGSALSDDDERVVEAARAALDCL